MKIAKLLATPMRNNPGNACLLSIGNIEKNANKRGIEKNNALNQAKGYSKKYAVISMHHLRKIIEQIKRVVVNLSAYPP